MQTSSAVASIAFLLSLAAPAGAMTSAPLVAPTAAPIVKTDFVQGHEAIAGIPARQAAARAESSAMAQRYLDVDAIVTLGALALASGAFVAVGLAGSRRRRSEKPAALPREGWREEIMQALEADLLNFTDGMRRAA